MLKIQKSLKIFSILSIILLNIVLSQNNNIDLSGFISDKNTGEVLIGANIFLLNSNIGTSTDINGYYALIDIPKDKNSILIISYIGYENYKINLSDLTSDYLDIELSPSQIQYEDIEVSAEQIKKSKRIDYSKIKLNASQFKKQPGVAEPDIFRTIQALPGVLTQSEFSTGLIVRGGNTDQNLILLDGITVYNPSHVGGVFSNFIVDGIKEAELTKGGYNADYGGRLSSVLNVVSREGNSKEIKLKMSASLLSTQATIEGPSYNGAYIISARRTYFDKVNDWFIKSDAIPPYYFYDLQAHIYTDINETDRISLSHYSGKDDFKFSGLGLNAIWGNNTNSIHYRKVFGIGFIGNAMIANSKFFTNFNLGGESGINNDNLISDNTLKLDLNNILNKEFKVKYGLLYKKLQFNYLSSFGDSILFEIDEKPIEMALYLKGTYKPIPQLILEPGFRYEYYNKSNKNTYPNFRLGIKYLFDLNNFITFSTGNYNQYILTFQDDFNPPLLDNWVSIDTSVSAGASNHFNIGYEHNNPNGYKFQTEFYYKTIDNLLTFEEKRATTDEEVSDENLIDILTPNSGKAYGTEIFLQKQSGSLTGWISYTLSFATKVMNDNLYYTNWDRRHALTIVGNYSFNKIKFLKNSSVSWNWTIQSGQAYTPILGYYLQNLPAYEQGTFHTIPSERNSGRYPTFHRLDISWQKQFKIKDKKGEFFFQVINLYNRKNIFRYQYSLGYADNGIDDDGDWNAETDDLNGDGVPNLGEPNFEYLDPDETKLQRTEISVFPFLPSFGIRIEL